MIKKIKEIRFFAFSEAYKKEHTDSYRTHRAQ